MDEAIEISINYEGHDYVVRVPDMETANLLMNDYEAAQQFLEGLNMLVPEGNRNRVPPGSDMLRPAVWTQRKPTNEDDEATMLLLKLRADLDPKFGDKKTSKAKLWSEIASKLKDKGYNLGENGTERCRQKFSNLSKAYYAYVRHQTETGTGEEDGHGPPPYFEMIHSILGVKHKAHPIHVQDSLQPAPQQDPRSIEETTSEAESEQNRTEGSTVENRFKKKKTQLKPSPNELILKEMQLDRESREKQFKVFEAHLIQANEQRDRFLSLFEQAIKK